jgi:hypothetical protein
MPVWNGALLCLYGSVSLHLLIASPAIGALADFARRESFRTCRGSLSFIRLQSLYECLRMPSGTAALKWPQSNSLSTFHQLSCLRFLLIEEAYLTS